MTRYERWLRTSGVDLSIVRSEEEVKIKLLLPYLRSLGYPEESLRFNNAIPVQIGTRRTDVFSDVDVIIDDRCGMVIETKNAQQPIVPGDVLQAESYAKLVATPPALFAVVFNGTTIAVRNVFDGTELDDLPTLEEFKAKLARQRVPTLPEPALDEARRILYTIQEREQLNAIFKACKQIIVGPEAIKEDKSFDVMSAFLVMKMAEEKRAREGQANRFVRSYVEG